MTCAPANTDTMHSVSHHKKSHKKSHKHKAMKKKMHPALMWMHKMVKKLRKEHPGKKFTWYAREAGRLYRKAHGKPEKSDKPTRPRRKIHHRRKHSTHKKSHKK